MDAPFRVGSSLVAYARSPRSGSNPMLTLAIALGSVVLFLVAYHTYGRWLAQRVFRLDARANVPSVELRDDRDFVPTAKSVVFGHHFTSIAGTGPIVGPAIAVLWGWAPALCWVVLGSIFIGAVHDFGSLVVSLRNRGQTVGDIAGRVLGPNARILFLLVLLLALTVVLAIFGLVMAIVFRRFPSAIFPCQIQIPIAIAIGFWIHRHGRSLLIPSILALAAMYASVIWGDVSILHGFNHALAQWSDITWVIALLIYSWIASVLPVWSLLQPRDYINSLQLISALGLIVAGLTVAAFIGGAPGVEGGARPELIMSAPAFNVARDADVGALSIFPFLFITVACGAISGFHCLVSSGTSSKQLRSESDAKFVGYGAMLTEAFLAVLVILACTAGLGLGVQGASGSFLTGESAWLSRYPSWTALEGLGAKIDAFVRGSANFLEAMGMTDAVAIPLMGVLVASFAGTTLDTACRLQRYVIQELASALTERPIAGPLGVLRRPLLVLTRPQGATLLAVTLAGAMASLPRPGEAWTWENAGKGGLILWPMFGATNQLLGGLAFVVIAVWLRRRRLPVIFVVVPMIFMLVMPAWAMLSELSTWWQKDQWVLVFVAVATLALEAWLIFEAARLWPRVQGELEAALPPLPDSPSRIADFEGGGSC
jgi:carbon starvation protein